MSASACNGWYEKQAKEAVRTWSRASYYNYKVETEKIKSEGKNQGKDKRKRTEPT